MNAPQQQPNIPPLAALAPPCSSALPMYSYRHSVNSLQTVRCFGNACNPSSANACMFGTFCSFQNISAAPLNIKRPPAFAGRAFLLLLHLVGALARLRQDKLVIPSLTPNALENAPCSPFRGFWNVVWIHFFTFFACSSAFFFAKYAWRSA